MTEEKTGKVQGYYLSQEVREWLAEQGKALDRSASWYLSSLVKADMETKGRR